MSYTRTIQLPYKGSDADSLTKFEREYLYRGKAPKAQSKSTRARVFLQLSKSKAVVNEITPSEIPYQTGNNSFKISFKDINTGWQPSISNVYSSVQPYYPQNYQSQVTNQQGSQTSLRSGRSISKIETSISKNMITSKKFIQTTLINSLSMKYAGQPQRQKIYIINVKRAN